MSREIKKLPTPVSDEYEYSVLRAKLRDIEYDEFIDLICNAVYIDGLPADVPQSFVIRKLIEHGRIGVYNNMWLPASVAGRPNLYGISKEWFLVGENGKTFTISDDRINAVIRLRPSARPLKEWLYEESDNLAYIKMTIRANLIACQNTEVYECGNKATADEMKTVFQKRALGMPAIFSRKEGMADNTKNLGSKTEFIADRLTQLYVENKNRVKERLGILTANSEKRERVQSLEITASVGEIVDSIYTFIDTFNEDAKFYGIPQRMRLNGTIEDLYANAMYTEDGETQNEIEKGEDENDS
ncbi:MAG: hypothetical protein II238_01280 [Alphaproteobacteria bacterium]|nr:hypothetical protein [Alphaproteobacteria bacterium]